MKDHSDSKRGNLLLPLHGLLQLAARVLLYAPFHRQESTYHGICYTSCGVLAGMRNTSVCPSIGIDLITHTHGATSHSIRKLASNWNTGNIYLFSLDSLRLYLITVLVRSVDTTGHWGWGGQRWTACFSSLIPFSFFFFNLVNLPVSTHTSAHVCTHTQTHALTKTHTATHTDTHSHTHKHTHRQTHTHTHKHKHMHSQTHTQTHTLTDSHTHKHTHRHTHTHAHTPKVIARSLQLNYNVY